MPLTKGGYAVVHLPNIKAINKIKGEYELFPICKIQAWPEEYSLLTNENSTFTRRAIPDDSAEEDDSSEEEIDLNEFDCDEGDLSLNYNVGRDSIFSNQ